MEKKLEDRFWDKVDKTPGFGPGGDCWLWTASKGVKGYGRIKVRGVVKRAHRVSWELVGGKPASDGLQILHHCDNPGCVNPDHLFLGDHQENMSDMKRKGRQLRGGSNPRTPLVESKVLEIRRLYTTGRFTQAKLASTFGISNQCISDVINGKTWGHV